MNAIAIAFFLMLFISNGTSANQPDLPHPIELVSDLFDLAHLPSDRTLHRSMELLMRNRLKVLRAEVGWSQEELGKPVGASHQAINAIEQEKVHPSLPMAFKLADVFQLSVEGIFLRNAQ